MIYLATVLLLWVLFIAYAGLRANWKWLRPEVKAIGIIVVMIGLALDVVVNWSAGLILGITRDVTFSQKCKRLGQGDDWRATVARYICREWLNVFDVGHC